MMNSLVVKFSPEELLELQAILMDEDEAAALKFLQDCVGPKPSAYYAAPTPTASPPAAWAERKAPSSKSKRSTKSTPRWPKSRCWCKSTLLV